MPNVVVKCDRCGAMIDGYEDPGVATGGFYRRNQAWEQFMNENETVVCDDCMWSDERYLAVYPHMRKDV